MSIFSSAGEFFGDLGASWDHFRDLRVVARDYADGDAGIATAIEDAAILKDDSEHGTRLKVHKQKESVLGTMFNYITSFSKDTHDIPKRGTLKYGAWIDSIWKDEPILAGAVYSMEAKMQSLTWKVEGGRFNAKQAAEMLSRARHMTGNGWSGFIASSAIDFYVQDNGVFWDVTRRNNSKYGKMTDLATIDSRCCMMTGKADVPMYYCSSLVSDEHWYKSWEFIRLVSMPLPAEVELGQGFCAVSRAARAAKLLMMLHDYDAEKISNLPPEGVASVTGLTDREFRHAIRLWMTERKKNDSLTFPQVLWLIGSNPNAKVSVDLTAFSSLPESYDRQTVVSQYVNTLALCFGVDTREFWAISTGALGTASEAEVQHMKARGKGGGEFISLVERHLNYEFPDDVAFEFDTQDIEEDMVNANVAKTWIDAYLPLVYPKDPSHEQIIDAKTFKRMMADNRILPEWAVGDDRVAIMSGEVHKDVIGDVLRFAWIAGKLSEQLLITKSAISFDTVDIVPSVKDALPVVSIEGTPIKDSEVERGARVTNKAIRNELTFWKTLPELAPHVPEEMIGSG